MTTKETEDLDFVQGLNFRDMQIARDEELDGELFWTGDMVLAAVMKKVSQLTKTHLSKSGFVLFGFEYNEDLSKGVVAYADKKVRVEPQEFYRDIRYMIGITKNLTNNN